MSLAQLLGVNESRSGSVTMTLNMSSSASTAPAAEELEVDVPLAAHERSRSAKRKAPIGPRGRAKVGRMSVEVKGVTKHCRLNEFPDQGLKVSAGALFCQPCALTLPNIRSSIHHHLCTNKHKVKLQEYVKKQENDQVLRTELSDYFVANPDEKHVSLHRLAQRE